MPLRNIGALPDALLAYAALTYAQHLSGDACAGANWCAVRTVKSIAEIMLVSCQALYVAALRNDLVFTRAEMTPRV